MSYEYEKQKKFLYTDEGQRKFVKVFQCANSLLDLSGCFRMDSIHKNVSGDSWTVMACVDRLVEIGIIKEAYYDPNVFGQHRIFYRD